MYTMKKYAFQLLSDYRESLLGIFFRKRLCVETLSFLNISLFNNGV